ncbi:MAG: exodeoxyribonuclease VII large subunit [Methanocalculus sp. MSAO_Arc1]|uniref:exodeoxyribonuclease VII large subunit n=1 Tax=Methanocalculus TaxID=71151 RepID=UPI000FF1A157|nr:MULTISPECIES: exodeoxyribonuclease VII large subunit [unclassified Methanocalculus]MCP1662068.1 exodeoxyribonuclease VII large subunit [Methanocalculus sp. AMF5]RQD80130.1 MAG: exodeoxyribonuclease VII large subunit [Methanocalculus sp. MSAO_Arc1]
MPGEEQAALVHEEPGILSVADLSGIIRERLDTPDLRGVRVRGEVWNFRLHSSGHMYFSLSEKGDDGNASIDCVIWKRAAQKISPPPENGMDVIVSGYIDHYPPFGKTQFVADSLLHAGLGGKFLLLEGWKKELAAEGCFAEERKKPLPVFPTRVGVVTSPTGAVLQDIRNVIQRRFPMDIILSGTAVQGETAHLDIRDAIFKIDQTVDVIILARGGGSFEDLFAFNHPDVVRAIASCETPLISAIGHEVDVTLADLASDLRAPTPSAAAELVVPDRHQLARELAEQRASMQNLLFERLDRLSTDLEDIRLRMAGRRLDRRISDMKQTAAELRERLERAVSTRLLQERKDIGHLAGALRSADIRAPLRRGYALLLADGMLIRSVQALETGKNLTIYLPDGEADATIETVRYD